MSFRCSICTQVQPAPSRPVRVVVEWRPKEYVEVRDMRPRGGHYYKKTLGREPAREAEVCALCALGRFVPLDHEVGRQPDRRQASAVH